MLALAADDKTRKQRQESMGEEGSGQAGPNSDETGHSPALPPTRAALNRHNDSARTHERTRRTSDRTNEHNEKERTMGNSCARRGKWWPTEQRNERKTRPRQRGTVDARGACYRRRWRGDWSGVERSFIDRGNHKYTQRYTLAVSESRQRRAHIAHAKPKKKETKPKGPRKRWGKGPGPGGV